MHLFIVKCPASYQCQDLINSGIYILKTRARRTLAWSWTRCVESGCITLQAVEYCVHVLKSKCIFFWRKESTRCVVLCLSLHITSGDHVDLLPKQPNVCFVLFFLNLKQYFFYKWMDSFPPVFFWLSNKRNNSLKKEFLQNKEKACQEI